MERKFQVEPNASEGRDSRFTGMPDAKEFPDLEPKQSAEKQIEQFENTVGKMDEDKKK